MKGYRCDPFKNPLVDMARYDRHEGHVDLVEISGMEHAFAEKPRLEPAPQTQQAVAVDDALVKWLHRRLVYGVRDKS
jgi:hypothetical protein